MRTHTVSISETLSAVSIPSSAARRTNSLIALHISGRLFRSRNRTAIGPGPLDTPFFYPAEGDDAVAYNKTAAAVSSFSTTGLTDIKDIVPFIRFLVSDGWWMTGQTNLVNGGYTAK